MILELLRNCCKSLEEANIQYMISGSIALNIYTIPRMTRDIDIVIELEEKNINLFMTIFSGYYYNESTIREEVKREGMFNIIDNKTGFKIDFIMHRKTEYFRIAFHRKRKVSEFNTEIWVISPEDLIIAKILWIQQYQSEKQAGDIKNLLLLPDIEMDYINHWCGQLNLNSYNLLSNE